jgi:hypothetical protein
MGWNHSRRQVGWNRPARRWFRRRCVSPMETEPPGEDGESNARAARRHQDRPGCSSSAASASHTDRPENLARSARGQGSAGRKVVRRRFRIAGRRNSGPAHGPGEYRGQHREGPALIMRSGGPAKKLGKGESAEPIPGPLPASARWRRQNGPHGATTVTANNARSNQGSRGEAGSGAPTPVRPDGV